jgi:hypothetical protein
MFISSVYRFIKHFPSTSLPSVGTRFTSPAPNTIRRIHKDYEQTSSLFMILLVMDYSGQAMDYSGQAMDRKDKNAQESMHAL